MEWVFTGTHEQEKPADSKFDSSNRITSGQVQKRIKSDEGSGLALMESSKLSATEVIFIKVILTNAKSRRVCWRLRRIFRLLKLTHKTSPTWKAFIDNPNNKNYLYLQQAQHKIEKRMVGCIKMNKTVIFVKS